MSNKSIMCVNEEIFRWVIDGLILPSDKTLEDLKAHLAEISDRIEYFQDSDGRVLLQGDEYLNDLNDAFFDYIQPFNTKGFIYKSVFIETDGTFGGGFSKFDSAGKELISTNLNFLAESELHNKHGLKS